MPVKTVRERPAPTRPALLAVLLVSLLWRLPSLFDPPWVNDEGTYFAVAQAMSHGYALYDGIWENKPPALYLLYTAVYQHFGASLFAIRLITAIAVLVLVSTAWRLGSQFVSLEWASSIALLTGLLLGVPFLEGTTGNAEVYVATLVAVAVEQGVIRSRWWAAGLLMGLAALFKVVALFDAAALGLFLLSFGVRDGVGMSWLRSAIAYVLAIGGVLAACCLLAARAGILHGMIQNAFLYDIGYVGHANGGAVPWLLATKLIVLVALTIALWRGPFPALWLVYASFGALFSGRIFGHYLLEPVLPLVLTLALLARRRIPYIARLPAILLAVFLLLAALFGLVGWGLAATGHDSILARRLQYYPNVVRLATGEESYALYRDEIDDHVSRNEAVARRLTRLPSGTVLVWGNTPWIYPLSHRLPATRYTSALRSPEVPGETSTLRAVVRHERARIIVVVSPAMPALGSAGLSLHRHYREVGRVGTAGIYVSLPNR